MVKVINEDLQMFLLRYLMITGKELLKRKRKRKRKVDEVDTRFQQELRQIIQEFEEKLLEEYYYLRESKKQMELFEDA